MEISNVWGTAKQQIGDAFENKQKQIDDLNYKVGDIYTTTRTDLGSNWKLCNGDIFNPDDYPELSKVSRGMDAMCCLASTKPIGTFNYSKEIFAEDGVSAAVARIYTGNSSTHSYKIYIRYSLDNGVNYSEYYLPISYFTTSNSLRSCVCLAYANNQWVIVADVADDQYHSSTYVTNDISDPNSWTKASENSKFDTILYDVVYNSGTYYLITGDGIATSTNLSSGWTSSTGLNASGKTVTIKDYYRTSDGTIVYAVGYAGDAGYAYTTISNPLTATLHIFPNKTYDTILYMSYCNGYFTFVDYYGYSFAVCDSDLDTFFEVGEVGKSAYCHYARGSYIFMDESYFYIFDALDGTGKLIKVANSTDNYGETTPNVLASSTSACYVCPPGENTETHVIFKIKGGTECVQVPIYALPNICNDTCYNYIKVKESE